MGIWFLKFISWGEWLDDLASFMSIIIPFYEEHP
jgi:hypothetical protein